MKIYTLPPVWSPPKFATRYSLNRDKDFYVNGDGKLVVFPTLPDDPPIFELPDPPKPGLADRLDAVKTLPDLIQLLKEELH
jgi:hypothetical protein